jgi:hypothetical protein
MSGFLGAILNANEIFAVSAVWFVIVGLFQCKDLSKTGAILLGLSLIGVAAWTTYQLQLQWLPIAEAMASKKVATNHSLTVDELKGFESHVNFFLWLLPFVTASWGTNILSDALFRDFTYKDRWIVRRLITDGFSGKSIFGSHGDVRMSLESRRDISEMARHDLQELIAELPQFVKVGKLGRLINMTDGSLVATYTPKGDRDMFACKLKVSWNGHSSPLDVDAARYLAVQFRCAASLGFNPASSRRKAAELFREIRGQ